MALGNYLLRVDFDGDDDLTDADDDVTPYVLSGHPLAWDYGRDYPSHLVGRSSPGKLECILDNSDGRFSRNNVLSPLYGGILPGRKVVLTGESIGFPYTFPFVFSETVQWTGFLDDIKPYDQANGVPQVKLTAYGPLARINMDDTSVPMQTNISTGAAVEEVLDRLDWPAGDRDIDTGQTTMVRWWASEAQGLTLLRELEQTESGFIRETKSGAIAFEDRHHRLSGARLVSQITYSAPAGSDIGVFEIVEGDPLRELFNVISARVQLYDVESIGVLWTLPETGSDSPVIAIGTSSSFWARYPNENSPDNAVAVDVWTTPLITTDFLGNSQADGLGVDLSSDLTVTVSKFSESMKIELENTGTSDIYLTFLQARGTAITARDGVTVKNEDASSKTAYGVRPYRVESDWLPSTAEANDRTRYELSIRREPITILQIVIAGNASEEHLIEALTRDVSDRITVVSEIHGISEDFFVERLTHTLLNGIHTVIVDCSPANGYSGFIVFDFGPPVDTGRFGY